MRRRRSAPRSRSAGRCPRTRRPNSRSRCSAAAACRPLRRCSTTRSGTPSTRSPKNSRRCGGGSPSSRSRGPTWRASRATRSTGTPRSPATGRSRLNSTATRPRGTRRHRSGSANRSRSGWLRPGRPGPARSRSKPSRGLRTSRRQAPCCPPPMPNTSPKPGRSGPASRRTPASRVSGSAGNTRLPTWPTRRSRTATAWTTPTTASRRGATFVCRRFSAWAMKPGRRPAARS